MKQQALQSQKPDTAKNNDEKQPGAGSPRLNGSQNASKGNNNK